MNLYYIMLCLCAGLYLVSLIMYNQKMLYLGLFAIFGGGTLLYLWTKSASISGLVGIAMLILLFFAGPKIEARLQPDKAAAEKYMDQKRKEEREAEERYNKIHGIQEKNKRKSRRNRKKKNK